MGTQKVKAEKVDEKAKPEKKEKQEKTAERASRKWKGKDWFMVISPELFGSRELGMVPATDPQGLMGRNLEVALSDMTGNPSKYYVKLHFTIASLDGQKALTDFKKMNIVKEHAFRIVRKRTSRVEVVQDVTTKDGYLLHISLLAILNRASHLEIQRKVRKKVVTFMDDFASKSTLNDFVKTVCDDLVQKNIKKFGSKIYPVRFCDVVKIEVKKAPKK